MTEKKTIEIVAHEACTGCGACFNKCPVDAITMHYDSEGFLFPKVSDNCIHCGQCETVCPALHPVSFHDTPESYAVMASDEIRAKSSSGGMFTLMANEILAQGGAVCGAAYSDDYTNVGHIWALSKEELAPLRGSKYVQSDTKLTYRDAKAYLEEGRPVLYTGCPCQIAGLYAYLGKDYPRLYTADLVCHGANSLTAYHSFLKELTNNQPVERVDFRDKSTFGWASATTVYLQNGNVIKVPHSEGTWYKGFLEGVITRQNCGTCPYAKAERVADITLADCWQVSRINKDYDDRKGTSLVLVNSEKGRALYEKLRRKMKLNESIPLEIIRKYNGQLNRPTPSHASRRFFFSHLPEDGYHKSLWYGRGMRFDVGIVGWWFASNYGSCLTYYALGALLADLGKQCLLIKLPTVSGSPWDADTRISIDFLKKYFKISADRDMFQLSEVNRFCDSFMLGSDQMWREDSIRLVGYSFFLDFVEKSKKKIAFSTSFGNEHFTDNEEIRQTVHDLLHRFDAISVREQSGVDVCRNEFDVEAQQVLDPVFLCGRAAYDRVTESVHDALPKKYLLCYILDPTPEKQQAACEIAQRKGLEIVTMLGMKEYGSAINRWSVGTVLPKITPEQFVYYIQNCDYLLTDSHHGTCFGIIYHKPYAALVNKSRGATRFETVADALGLRDRLIYDVDKLSEQESIYEMPDYAKVDARLEVEKARALKWLTDALDAPTKPHKDTINTISTDKERKIIGLTQRVKTLEGQMRNLNAQLEQNKRALDALRMDMGLTPVTPSAKPTEKERPTPAPEKKKSFFRFGRK